MRMTTHLGKRGTLVVPAALRKQLNLEEGSLLIMEVHEGNTLCIRPAKAIPVEKYSESRAASFILNDAYDAESYAKARDLVQRMGLDPDKIPHDRPDGPTNSGVS